jgi:hypothetical protein
MSTVDEPAVRRPLLIALGALAALAGLWFLVLAPMLNSADEDDTFVVERPPRPAAAESLGTAPDSAPGTAPGAAPGEEPSAGDLLPESYEVFSARDPFHELVSDDQGSGGTPVAQPVVQPGAPDGSTGGSTDGGSEPDGSGSDGAQVGGTDVKLVDVYDAEGVERAIVSVNGRTHDVAEGETFAERFRMLDISGSCATILFGDSRFVLCEGEEIRK